MRVPLNAAWARELETFLDAQIADVPDVDVLHGQAAGIFASGYYRDLGLLHYAEGKPLADVRALLRRSVEYTHAVFAMRGPDEPWRAAPDDEDTSLTNSRRALHTMELALACGALDLAERFAPLVWDPPHASYLGPGSVVCSAEEQTLAYALRDLLLHRDDESEAVRALDADDTFAPLDASLRARGGILLSVAAQDAAAFTIALAALHDAHLRRVRGTPAIDRLDDLLDVPALAYSALAAAHFANTTALLPVPDPYFPVPLAWAMADTHS